MPTDPQSVAEQFKAALEAKIQGLVAEFAEGKISREQFHVLYERYNARLSIASHALLSGNPDAVSIAQGGPPTIAVRDAYEGKALGMVIYHHRSRKILEVLGEFDVPAIRYSSVLREFSQMREQDQFIEKKIEKISLQQWLVFLPGEFTSVVTLFRNEPSQQQLREIERLHHDFEKANHAELTSENVTKNALAYPFLVFIQEKLTTK